MRRIPVLLLLLAAWSWVIPRGWAQASAGPSGQPANRSAFSDFNNDGFADQAIGVPFENVGGAVDAGAVNVLYGSAGGLQATSPDDQFWNQDSPGVRDTAEAEDEFGWSLGAGDFNNDGFADLAIGVPVESGGGLYYVGAVNVLYGSAGGLQATSPDDQLLQVRDAYGFGTSLGAGDFNNDGFADLAIGVFAEEVGTEGGGAVNVLYGSAGGLQATSPDDQLWSQDSAGVRGTAEAEDGFGFSLGAGDFNNDGFADLAIGVPGESGPGGALVAAGAVNVLYGSAGGLQATSPDDQLWTQDSPGVRDIAEVRDKFGLSLGAGDFNNDGFADLAIGVPWESRGPVIYVGAVNVLYGSAGGLQATSPDDQFWNQDSPGVRNFTGTEDEFGYSLEAGDFNNDGFADLAIGVPFEGSGPVIEPGAVNVLYGSAGGLQATSPDDQFWNQGSPGVRGTAEDNDHFGLALGAGDFNNDGFADLAIGVPIESVGALLEAGAVNVLYGSAGGLQATSPDDQLWTQDSPGVRDIAEPFDVFGDSLGGGGRAREPLHRINERMVPPTPPS